MSPLICPRCQHANPVEAVFCYFDGAELRPSSHAATFNKSQLPHDFVMPSGRHCSTFDAIVQACQDDWDLARGLLQQGVFGNFLAGIGRLDLAQAALKALANPDLDVGLHSFLNDLPAIKMEGPRLDLSTRRLILGKLLPGDTRQVVLTVTNQGKGLLYGTLTVPAESTWLHAVGANGEGQLQLKAVHDQQVILQVQTDALASQQSYLAKLTVITNGGIVEVPVSLELAPHPFSHVPFEGVSSPREMAVRMRSQPKPAVPLLESGEVARWFAANGWTFPVQGPTARGVGAVQQFFEVMGLAKAPVVQVSPSKIHLVCPYPGHAEGQVKLHTAARKWIYARAESDVPWLRLTRPDLSGPQQAVFEFEVDAGLLEPDSQFDGTIHFTANAGQTFAVGVSVEVRRPPQSRVSRLLRPLWTGALAGLVFRLLLVGPADLYARVWAAGPHSNWSESPLTDDHFVKHFVQATWWLGALAGAWLMKQRGSRRADVPCGLIAGAAAGIAGSATFACLWPLLDALPRSLWSWWAGGSSAGPTTFVALATLGWIGLALTSWTVMGALAGLLLHAAGRSGARVLARIAEPLNWLLRGCGLKSTGV